MQIAPINIYIYIYIYEYHFFGLSALCSCYVATSLERLDILMVLFFFLESKSGLGIVIRDNAGLVIASCSQLLPQAYLTCEVEALAAVKALTLPRWLVFRRPFWRVTRRCLWRLWFVMMFLWLRMDLWLKTWRFFIFIFQLHYSYVKRECNKVAHCLTRHAIIVSNLTVWMKNIPPQFISTLQANFVGFS